MAIMKLIDDDEAVQDLIDQALGDSSPFNIIRDYENIFGKNHINFKPNIRRDIMTDLEKPQNSHIKLQGIEIQQIDVSITKIRAKNPRTKASKRDGIRCIVLLDWIRNEAMLIHMYDKKKKHDLTKTEVKYLSQLHKLYVQSM